MDYEQFVCAMLACVKEELSETETVERQEILRNNGVVSTGLSIRNLNKRIAPIIYMEEFYEKYLWGAEIEELCRVLIQAVRNAVEPQACNYEDLKAFQKIKNQIVYKLVNAQMNEKLLKEIPHLPILDFAIIFYWMVPEEHGDCGMVLIRNAQMEMWKLPISVLYHCAKENTPKLCPCVFRSLTEYMEEVLGERIPDSPLYILSNRSGVNGAAVILYPGVLGEIYDKLQQKYYLLPSSIHEFLIVPENEFLNSDNLRNMVREVNETQLSREELLSDHIYYFNGDIVTKI